MKLAIFGILLNIFGGFGTTLGYVLQRKSHNQIRKDGGSFYKHPIWWLSLIILISATFIYMISMSMTNQSTLSVIGPMGLIISVAMGKFFLNEQVTRYEVIGIAFITPGSIITLLFASLNNKRYNREEFELLLQSKLSFGYFMFVVSLFTIGFTFSCIILSMQQNKTPKLENSDEIRAKIENLNDDDDEQVQDVALEPHHKHKQHTLEEYSPESSKLGLGFSNPKWKVLPLFILTWFAGFSSSISSTFTRSTWGFLLSEPPKNSTSNFDNISSFVYLSLGPVMVVGVFLSINKALQYFETIYVVPMFKASVLLNNLLSGGIFLREFGEYDFNSFAFFLVGILAGLLGILSLLLGKGKNNSEDSMEVKKEGIELQIEELAPVSLDEETDQEIK